MARQSVHILIIMPSAIFNNLIAIDIFVYLSCYFLASVVFYYRHVLKNDWVHFSEFQIYHLVLNSSIFYTFNKQHCKL